MALALNSKFDATLASRITDLGTPVITSYDLGKLVFELCRTGIHAAQNLKGRRKGIPFRRVYKKALKSLFHANVLEHKNTAPNDEVFFMKANDDSSSEVVACYVDPFSYISHMSAMEWHDLTDRASNRLTISSPISKEWSGLARARMQKELGGSDALTIYCNAGLPLLRRLRIDRIGGNEVHRYISLHLGACIPVPGKNLRVATVGRTFLDMIREPDLCGGIRHVLEAYRKHAQRHLDQIVEEVDGHGTKIDKVRTGYILSERVQLRHGLIDKWRKFAARGGSRKLCAQREYSPSYSEAWCLSLNIKEPAER